MGGRGRIHRLVEDTKIERGLLYNKYDINLLSINKKGLFYEKKWQELSKWHNDNCSMPK